MKKIIGLVAYGAIMFGITAGVGMLLLKQNTPAPVEEDEADAKSSGKRGGFRPEEPTLEEAADLLTEVIPREDEQLPVAVRASPMTVEEIVRMGLSLKAREETIRKREESLREFETQQRLALSDITAYEQTVDNLLAQMTDQRAAKEVLLSRIAEQTDAMEKLLADQKAFEQTRQAFEADKLALSQRESDFAIKVREFEEERKRVDADKTRYSQEGDALRKEREAFVAEKEKIAADRKSLEIDRKSLQVERDLLAQDKRAFAGSAGIDMSTDANGEPLDPEVRKKNYKDIATKLSNMSPENGASLLKTMAAEGKEAMVVEVLDAMEPRKAGAIMDMVQDDVLASKLLDLFSKRNGQSKAAARP